MMMELITFNLNGKQYSCEISTETSLLSLIRETFGLTGTKKGCEVGDCGSCSVLLDGHLVKSCQIPAVRIKDRSVVTIEGLTDSDGGLEDAQLGDAQLEDAKLEDAQLSDLQKAFLKHGATQCGYCTPAMILAGESVLRKNSTPSREDIKKAISSVLCRCTGYQQIVDAIYDVSLERAGKLQPSSEVPYPHQSMLQAAAEGRKFLHIGDRNAQAVDGLEKVTGITRFVDDIHFPGTLHAKVLRSPLPHAVITHLDTQPALAVPGVLAVITSEDFVDHGNFGWPVKDAYILAHNKVRYVGDPIAAVAAETEAAAMAGVEAIKFELQPLPVVDSVQTALDDQSPIIPDNPPNGSNLCLTHIVRNGDPQPLLADTPINIDQTYTFQHQEHAYLELEGALAIPEIDGSVTIYANDQSPFINRDNTAAVLGLSKEMVRIIQPPVGGSFGGKDDIGYQCTAQAARLALITGRPVKLVLKREESMKASYKREAMDIRLQVGANAEGTLQAVQADLFVDSGAYASMTPLSSWRASMHAGGAYRYRAAQVDTHVLYTNNGYSGAFRGFGNTQACAAIEVAIDELAHQLNIDPIDFRLKNVLVNDDHAFTGNQIEFDITLDRCLNWVREKSDWDQKRAAYASHSVTNGLSKGIGVACYFHGSGLGGEGTDYATAKLRIEPDNSLTLQHGMTDYGQGSRTVFTMLAAEVMGIQPERIHMLRPDTQTANESGPTVASRATLVGGNAVKVTASKLNRTLLLAAGDLLGCQQDEVRPHMGLYISPSENEATFEEVVDHARKLGLQLSAEGYWQIPEIHWDFETGTGIPYFTYCYGAQVAEVEVSQEKQIKVKKIWAVHDAGTIIFPVGAEGQMLGGIAQGIGYALTEGFSYQAGYPQKVNLSDYEIPTSLDMPEIEIAYLDTFQNKGPFGAKGLAEPTMVATAPAIANAIFHATGQRLRDFPLRLERIG